MKAPSRMHRGFDEWSRTYDRSVLQGVFFDRVHDALLQVLRPLLRGIEAPRVLDVGCGTGRLLAKLRAELPNAELSGVDASAGMIEVARGKPELAGVRLEVASAAALPFDDASVDAALSTMSFHHWDDQPGGVHGVARVLRPGAPLLLVDVYSIGVLAPWVRRFGRTHGSGMRSDGEIAAMFAAAGMAPVELRRLGPPLSPLGIMVARRAS
jgi:ubiquinone/menaquinone biosynthesis C-methylase UbiE